MANLHWKTEKTDKDTTIRMLMEILPDYTPSAFKVRQEGDDSGTYMSVYVERTDDDEEICKELPQTFEGWRTILIYCPFEYIKFVMESKRE